jgi:hypothetical protein
MSEKRFKIGDRVKVVSIKGDAPKDTIGLLGTIKEKSDSLCYDWRVFFESMGTWYAYNDCDLEPAAATKPGTVKVEIEIPVIPEDKIPAGMKLGNPAYEKRVVKNNDVAYMQVFKDLQWQDGWGKVDHFFAGSVSIVANFVPIEPEEPEFIDREVTTSDHAVLYQVKAPDDFANWRLSDIACHIQFIEYLWLDADGKIIYSDVHFFRTKKHGVCTHVRFINPKYKKGE